MTDIERFTRRLVIRGGKGSGHRGHKGRKGQRGGSEPTYPEGMAPSDQPSARKWRRYTDEQLEEAINPNTDQRRWAEADNMAREVGQLIRGQMLTDFGQNIGASVMGGYAKNPGFAVIQDYYAKLRDSGLTAFNLARDLGEALEDAKFNVGYSVTDQDRQVIGDIGRYFTNLADGRAWIDGEVPGMGDEEAQWYVLNEITMTLYYNRGSIIKKDGSPNWKDPVMAFVKAKMKSPEAFTGLMDAISDAAKDVEKQQKTKADYGEARVEERLMQNADAIDAAFSFAEGRAEEIRKGLLDTVLSVQEAKDEMQRANMEAERLNTIARDKKYEITKKWESSPEFLAAKKRIDQDTGDLYTGLKGGVNVVASERLAALEADQKERVAAHQTIARIDKQADEEFHQSEEWKASREAYDILARADSAYIRALEQQGGSAREYLTLNCFGEASGIVPGDMRDGKGRRMNEADRERQNLRSKDARVFLAQIVNPDFWKGKPPVHVLTSTASRANYREATKSYQVNAGSDVSTHVHEIGHWLEDVNKDVHAQAVAFLRYRNGDEPYLKMSAARRRAQKLRAEGKLTTSSGLYTRGFTASEIAAVDRWRDPYAGKKYADYDATEVLSMGLDWMYADPVRFAQEDPEHFNFTLAMIAGVW